MNEVLISIKPKYIDLILSGRKTVELRKRSRITPGTRLILYASSPRCAVVGEALVSFREELTIDTLWTKHGEAAGVGKEELDGYYADAPTGVALGLTDVFRYQEDIPLSSLRDAKRGFQPPQSYMRAPAFIGELLRQATIDGPQS